MNNKIVKTCPKHGELTIEQVLVDKKGNGKIYYKCKLCRKLTAHQNYEKNKSKILTRHKQYKQLYPEKKRALDRRSYQNNKERFLELQRIRQNKEPSKIKKRISTLKSIDKLDDWYVRKVICKGTSLSATDIPKSLVEFKRDIIKLNRTIKDNNKNTREILLRDKLLKLEEKLNENKNK